MRAVNQDYERVERAIRFLDEHFREQPSLAEVSRHVDLSEYHFQRLFRRWAGVSPKRFLQCLTAAHAERVLAESRSVLDAAWESGLSGPSRLHDLLVAVEAMTPGEVRSGGAGLELSFGVGPTPYGDALVVESARGISALEFIDGDGTEGRLRERWPNATWREDPRRARRTLAAAFGDGSERPTLHVAGTNFQVAVWRALLAVPEGLVIDYGDLAARAGHAGAAQAVGQAVGANPVAYLIPCHRVLRRTGALGGYKWGDTRKRAMLVRETADREGTVSR